MASIKMAEENPNGLHQKYIVSHANGKPVDPEAVYFVLRLDGNHLHNIACRSAALEWCREVLVRPDNPLTQTAEDLKGMTAKL